MARYRWEKGRGGGWGFLISLLFVKKKKLREFFLSFICYFAKYAFISLIIAKNVLASSLHLELESR